MIHYHGLPITPATAAVRAIAGGHAFVSFAHADQISIALETAQSFAVDNGAFSAWKAGSPVTDWSSFYKWICGLRRRPSLDFVVIPDVINGDEKANDELVRQWPFGHLGAPVWHLHEPIARLKRLAEQWPRVCLGSSGDFATVGSKSWRNRMAEAMDAICDADGLPSCRLHGLRMLDPSIFSWFPFASADSTNIARNIGIDSAWRGTYPPPTKEARATVMRERIEHVQAATHWTRRPYQSRDLFGDVA